MLNRRHFLQASIAGLGAGAGFASNLASLNAFAADAADYKALVCVFLYGGMDGHDSIIPYDAASYEKFRSIRQPLLSGYEAIGTPRRRENLLPLLNSGAGRTFSLPAEFSELRDLYKSGNAAIVGNVGPMIEPMNRQTYQNRSANRPANLFSHNDQQSTWMAFHPEGAKTGWGGRFGDIMVAADANVNSAFTTVSTSGSSIYLTGENVIPFVTNYTGAATVKELGKGTGFSTMYEESLRDLGGHEPNLFHKDLSRIVNSSLNNNATLDESLALPGDPATLFPQSKLASQLRMVARMIARRDVLGMKRQIFFVTVNGFDTHSNQAEQLAELQSEVSSSISAFYNSLIEMGVENQVTTFTASDFGRTLGVNGDGTDHGWGSHHFVVGGAVNGGQIHGDIPPPELGHNYDCGRGRLIPQISVDQYAGAFGNWFGVSQSEMSDAIPGISNFDNNTLDDLLF